MSLNIFMRTAGYLRPAERVYIRLFVIHAYLDFSLSSHTKCTKALSRYLVEISSGRPESDNFQTFLYYIFMCICVPAQQPESSLCIATHIQSQTSRLGHKIHARKNQMTCFYHFDKTVIVRLKSEGALFTRSQREERASPASFFSDRREIKPQINLSRTGLVL